jgi:hypothetical protein
MVITCDPESSLGQPAELGHSQPIANITQLARCAHLDENPVAATTVSFYAAIAGSFTGRCWTLSLTIEETRGALSKTDRSSPSIRRVGVVLLLGLIAGARTVRAGSGETVQPHAAGEKWVQSIVYLGELAQVCG